MLTAPKKLRHTRAFKAATDVILWRLPLPNINPNFVTALSLAAAVLFLWLFPAAGAGILLFLLALSILFDTLDGAVARRHNRVTAEGYYFDVATDRLSEALLILPFLGTAWEPWFLAVLTINLAATLVSITTKRHFVPFNGKFLLLVFLLWQWVI